MCLLCVCCLYCPLYDLVCVLLSRRDFAVQFGSEESTSVFFLLQQACIQLAKVSHHIHQREVNTANQSKQFLYRGFVYNRFMWGEC